MEDAVDYHWHKPAVAELIERRIYSSMGKKKVICKNS
jgi:hypothetical protein